MVSIATAPVTMIPVTSPVILVTCFMAIPDNCLVMTATVTGISRPYIRMMFPRVTLVYYYLVSMVPVEMVPCR